MSDFEFENVLEEGISITVTVHGLDEEYWTTYNLEVPNDDFDLNQFEVLLYGLDMARLKILELIEKIDEEEDYDDE